MKAVPNGLRIRNSHADSQLPLLGFNFDTINLCPIFNSFDADEVSEYPIELDGGELVLQFRKGRIVLPRVSAQPS